MGLTIKEASEKWGISPVTIRKCIVAGIIPHEGNGRPYIIPDNYEFLGLEELNRLRKRKRYTDKYPGYIGIEDAAQRQGVSRQLIHKMIVSGAIKGAIQDGKHWLIPEDPLPAEDPHDSDILRSREALENHYIRLAEAEKISGIKRYLLNDMCARGDIPDAIRVRKIWYIKKPFHYGKLPVKLARYYHNGYVECDSKIPLELLRESDFHPHWGVKWVDGKYIMKKNDQQRLLDFMDLCQSLLPEGWRRKEKQHKKIEDLEKNRLQFSLEFWCYLFFFGELDIPGHQWYQLDAIEAPERDLKTELRRTKKILPWTHFPIEKISSKEMIISDRYGKIYSWSEERPEEKVPIHDNLMDYLKWCLSSKSKSSKDFPKASG